MLTLILIGNLAICLLVLLELPILLDDVLVVLLFEHLGLSFVPFELLYLQLRIRESLQGSCMIISYLSVELSEPMDLMGRGSDEVVIRQLLEVVVLI